MLAREPEGVGGAEKEKRVIVGPWLRLGDEVRLLSLALLCLARRAPSSGARSTGAGSTGGRSSGAEGATRALVIDGVRLRRRARIAGAFGIVGGAFESLGRSGERAAEPLRCPPDAEPRRESARSRAIKELRAPGALE